MRCGGTEIVMEQKIKQDKIQIGKNIRRIRKQNKLKQTDMVVRLQLMGMDMTREALVKIERGIQHIYASQLKAIKEVLGTTYDELLSEDSSEEK
jgi:transcriptional regulator with XRE-family HTH domain